MNEAQYNDNLTVSDITDISCYNPQKQNLLLYSKPDDSSFGIDLHVGNMNSHYLFRALGYDWKSIEYLYLCGEWSLAGQRCFDIQRDILTAKSGYAAKRFKKSKYKKEIRPDFPQFRAQWMLWCVWQKCIGNKDFCNHLTSLPHNRILIELVDRDPIWAAYYDSSGLIRGANGMGKILTICRNCLDKGIEPEINRTLLNSAEIYIFGAKINF